MINSNVFINTLENDDDTVQIVQTSETLTSGEKKVMPTNWAVESLMKQLHIYLSVKVILLR